MNKINLKVLIPFIFIIGIILYIVPTTMSSQRSDDEILDNITKSINSSGHNCDSATELFINTNVVGKEVYSVMCKNKSSFLVMHHNDLTKVLSCDIANIIDNAHCFEKFDD